MKFDRELATSSNSGTGGRLKDPHPLRHSTCDECSESEERLHGNYRSEGIGDCVVGIVLLVFIFAGLSNILALGARSCRKARSSLCTTDPDGR